MRDFNIKESNFVGASGDTDLDDLDDLVANDLKEDDFAEIMAEEPHPTIPSREPA